MPEERNVDTEKASTPDTLVDEAHSESEGNPTGLLDGCDLNFDNSSLLNSMKNTHLIEGTREAEKVLSRLQDIQSRHLETLESSLELQARLDGELGKLNHKFEKAFEAFNRKVEHVQEETEASFRNTVAGLEAAFTQQQAIRAPVKLWSEKQLEHEKAKERAFAMFLAGLTLASIITVILILALGIRPHFFETLLAPIGCDPQNPETTCAGFSLKGTIIATGVLSLYTLLLWFTRLQMKLFLAERHLALDARERQAFAQSFIGLVREGDVSEEAQEQRALVYAALFRPASDGTVREEGGLDPSIAAAVSKLLTR